MLPEDDPLNMSIHSRRNVWEEKINDGEQQKQEVVRMHEDLRTPKRQQLSGTPAQSARAKPAAQTASPKKVTDPSPSKSPTRVRYVRQK